MVASYWPHSKQRKIFLQRALTNDLDKIGPGRAQYTHLLDVDASVLDDIIVWWIDEQTFEVFYKPAELLLNRGAFSAPLKA